MSLFGEKKIMCNILTVKMYVEIFRKRREQILLFTIQGSWMYFYFLIPIVLIILNQSTISRSFLVHILTVFMTPNKHWYNWQLASQAGKFR